MSQEYTPIIWTDETPNTPGTLINKARLDQMQSAHHFADGFEEVDAVPTADPGVDYHKVVFCTADTTFYRWDGSQWVKDVDDTTKALLEAHEADHSNPHVVTKAQVGLGNCDNTSDLDKPVSTATQTALDGKVAIIPVTSGVKFYSQSSGGTSLYQGTSSPVTGITSVPLRDSSGRIKTAAPSANDDAADKKYVDDADALKLNNSALVSAWQGTPDDDHIPTEKLVKDTLDLKINTSDLVSAWQVTPDDAHIPSEKLVKTYVDTSLTDGSVTKVGTATVGGDLKPVYLNAGVPTAVANDFVDVASAQTVGGAKTWTGEQTIVDNWLIAKRSDVDFTQASSSNIYINGTKFVDKNAQETGAMFHYYETNGDASTWISSRSKVSGTIYDARIGVYVGSTGTKWATAPSRTYNASNTSDIVTIGSLQASTDVVHTAGNETIAGTKTFQSSPQFLGNSSDLNSINLRNNNISLSDMTGGHNTSIAFRGQSDALLMRIRYRNGTVNNVPTRTVSLDLYDANGNEYSIVLATLVGSEIKGGWEQ